MDKKIIRNKITDLFKESRPKALEGGLADGKTIKDIAKKHKVSPSTIRNQINKGKDVEKDEHTNDPDVAIEIAKDHEVENPKYYDDLENAGIEKDKS